MNDETLKAAVAIIGSLMLAGAILKHAFPAFPNRFIPLFTWLGGSIAFCVKQGDWTANGILTSVMVVTAATGAHSGFKNLFGSSNADSGAGPVPINKGPLLVFILAAGLAVGCATRGTPEFDAEVKRTGRITATLAFNGTTLAMISHPEWGIAFDQAATSLEALSSRDTLTILDVYEALRPLPVREFKSPEAKLIVGNAQLILEEFGAGEVDLDRVPHLKAAAAGLARGIRQGRAP